MPYRMPNFIELATKQKQRKIVLPESQASRILEAATYCDQHKIAEIILLGENSVILDQLSELSLTQGNIQIINPLDHLEEYTDILFRLVDKKSFTMKQALELSQQPLYFADLMVRAGKVDASVAGAINTTGDVIRTALKVIGTERPKSRPSSFFIIQSAVLPTPVLFADCAMNIVPNTEQLVNIAYQSSKSIKALLDLTPKIALLSFSTKGSARHRNVTKVREATEIFQTNYPELDVIGEVQFDAALSREILEKKWSGSSFEAPANVFIFPSLEAANIGYKIAEHMGHAKTIGPILQGLAKPVNDLSRGANIQSIINTIAVTALQVEDIVGEG